MRLSITDRSGIMDNDVLNWAERRLQFALSRFSSRIRGVKATVSDESVAGRKHDRTVRLVVRLRGAEDVVVSGTDSHLNACFSSVAERAARSVGRAIDRSREFDRRQTLKSVPSFIDHPEYV